jgi:hypothetical protein
MSPLDFENSITAPSPLFSKYDSSPNLESIVQGDKYRFTVLSEGCIRYEYSPDGSFEDRVSTFAVHRNLAKPKYTLLKHDVGGLEIKTDRLHLQYDGKEFTASGLYCDCRAKSEFYAVDMARLIISRSGVDADMEIRLHSSHTKRYLQDSGWGRWSS